MSYLEAGGMTVDIEVLNGDLSIIAHKLAAERAAGWQWAAGEDWDKLVWQLIHTHHSCSRSVCFNNLRPLPRRVREFKKRK